MKKIFVLILCLLGVARLWAQDNTVLGTGALAQATSPKYAIQTIQINSPGSYARPTIDMGSHAVQWEYQYIGVDQYGVNIVGYFSSTTDLGSFIPIVVGGHGTGATLNINLSWTDGINYYYEVYSGNEGSGYVPQVTFSSSTGTNYEIHAYIDENNNLQIDYYDHNKTNLYATAPTVFISFGGATATAILEGIAANTQNTAVGYQALYSNVNGRENTALGHQALYNANGITNLGLGVLAGSTLTTGNNNLFIGKNAGNGITTGSGNVFIGNGSNLNLSSSLYNSMIFTDGSGSPRMFVGNSGAVKIGYGYDFTETSSARLMVNGSINATSSLNATHAYLSGQLSFKNSASTYYHDFMFHAPNPNTFSMRAVVDANNYPWVFSVDKPSASMTFYAPVKGVSAVNNNEFVTFGQLASGQTIGANISGSANLSNVLSNANISGQDLTNSSIVSASSFKAMNGSGVIGAPDDSWWNILSMRHSNAANDYRMEIAGSFSDPQKIVFRNTADSPGRGWSTFFHSGNTDYVRTTLGLPANPLRSHRAVDWITYPGANANTIEENTSSFTYNFNAPTVGPLTHFGNGGYGLQLNAAYFGGTGLYFRTRNGDGNLGWNGWNAVFHSGNIEDVKTALGLPNTGAYTLDDVASRNNILNRNISFGQGNNMGFNWGYNGDLTSLYYNNSINGNGKLILDIGDDNLLTQGLQIRGVRYDNVINEIAYFSANGDVGLGTTTPKEKLSVNGKIRAREVKVEPVNGWPDYVFEDGYKPKTLQEIEAFIKVNKHLPEVPSAKEVQKDGIELGVMNKVLLKKIEELTLHLIEKDKELKATNDRIDQLSEILKQLMSNKKNK